MEWYAEQLGYGDEKAFWGMAGLLHDIDFELYPEEHCERAPELLRDGGAEEDLVHVKYEMVLYYTCEGAQAPVPCSVMSVSSSVPLFLFPRFRVRILDSQ